MENQTCRLISFGCVWMVACQLALPGQAEAQMGTRPMQGPNRPTTSPYLGLLNTNGNSAAINYYTQVRPQRQLRAGAAALQQELRDVQKRQDEGVIYDELGVPLLPQSGHPTSFQNQRNYFGTGPSSSFSSAGGASSRAPIQSRSGTRPPSMGPRTR